MDRCFRIALIESGIDTITHLSLVTEIERTKLSRIVNRITAAKPDEKRLIAQTLGLPVEMLFPESA